MRVLKTSDHFEVLRRYQTESGTATVIVTLTPAEERTARTTKRVVEIRLDDARIGQLSPVMSEKFLPAVDHLLARRLTVAAPAGVTVSAVAAQVSLRAQKAFELSPKVLDGPPVTIPPRGVGGK